jgi:hypothetical protein
LIIGGIIVGAIAAGVVIIGISADPAFQKGASITLAGVIRGISIRVVEFNRLMNELMINAFVTAAQGIIAVNEAAQKLKKTFAGCAPLFLALQAATTRFVSSSRGGSAQESLNALMRNWITALAALLACLRANGATADQLF